MVAAASKLANKIDFPLAIRRVVLLEHLVEPDRWLQVHVAPLP
jgi:hypothetical protein